MTEDDICRQFWPIAWKMVHAKTWYLSAGRYERDEILSYVNMSLVGAARTWNPIKGPLEPWMVMKIKWAIFQAYRNGNNGGYWPRTAGVKTPTSLSRLVDEGYEGRPQEDHALEQVEGALPKIPNLTERESDYLQRVYGERWRPRDLNILWGTKDTCGTERPIGRSLREKARAYYEERGIANVV